jgi:hypothetical protein
MQHRSYTAAFMTAIDVNRNNFEAWYGSVLDSLYPNRDAGIVVFMITLPLAERYIRQVNAVPPEEELTDSCMQSLCALFPALVNIPLARQFWATYRHGFLHQATLSQRTKRGQSLPAAWLSHDIAAPLEVRSDGSLWVNPVPFSQTVLAAIRTNFSVFVGRGNRSVPLPSTVIHMGTPGAFPTMPTYIGTGGRS